jgi:hypothetical protein
VYAFCWDQIANCGYFYKGVEYHRLLQCNRQDEHDKYICIRGIVEYCVILVRVIR